MPDTAVLVFSVGRRKAESGFGIFMDLLGYLVRRFSAAHCLQPASGRWSAALGAGVCGRLRTRSTMQIALLVMEVAQILLEHTLRRVEAGLEL